jgi:hypothetical protein
MPGGKQVEDNNLNEVETVAPASAEVQCARCKEYASDIEIYEVILLVLAFLGPIIGILIGLFAGKKLIKD